MRITINSLYWYFGIPIVLFLGIRGLRQYKATGNLLDRCIGWMGIFFTFSLLAYGLGPILSADSAMLTYSTILGGLFQFIALFFLWLAVARLYSPKSKLGANLIVAFDIILVMIASYLSITQNLATPTTISQLPNGFWVINYVPRPALDIATSLQYACLLLIGAMFIYQALTITTTKNKRRTILLGSALFMVGVLSCLRALVITVSDTAFQYLTIMIATVVVVLIIGSVISTKKTN
ncbi:MAG: hypothetical protein WCN86_01260 [bacterium]